MLMRENKNNLKYEVNRASELKKEAGEMVNEQVQKKAKGIRKAL